VASPFALSRLAVAVSHTGCKARARCQSDGPDRTRTKDLAVYINSAGKQSPHDCGCAWRYLYFEVLLTASCRVIHGLVLWLSLTNRYVAFLRIPCNATYSASSVSNDLVLHEENDGVRTSSYLIKSFAACFT